MTNSLTYFPVSGDWRNVSDPVVSDITNVPDVEIVEGFVTFYPRLPEGFLAYIDDYLLVNAVSAVQSVTFANAAGGTFTLTFNGQTTSAIAYNASATTVQTALRALSSVGGTNVAVAGSNGGPYTITFQGALAGQPNNILVVDITSTTGPSPSIVVATATAGVPAVNAVQTVTLSGSPTGGTFNLKYAGQTSAAIAYNAAATVVQAALQAIPSIGAGNASVAGSNGGPYVITFVGARGGQFIAPITAGDHTTGGTHSIAVAQTTTGVNAVNEVQTVTVTAALSGTFTLTYSGQTTSAIAYGASSTTVQNALAALSNVGVGNVAVTYTGGVYTVTFQGTLAGTDVAQMTANSGGLVGVVPTSNAQHVTFGLAQESRDTAVAIPARKARIWNGMLSTIDIVDTPGVELVSNSPALDLLSQGYSHLVYDVQFSSVTYAKNPQTLKNFAFLAPTDTTPVCITDPALPRLDYEGP